MGDARTHEWDDETEEDVEIAPNFEDGLSFAWYESGAFHRVSLPSTLRYIGVEAFCGYDFEVFTLPAQLEVLEHYAFYACSFEVLRIETTLPIEDILYSMKTCTFAIGARTPAWTAARFACPWLWSWPGNG